MNKNYDKFSFEERKNYEETFVNKNDGLIKSLTGASTVYNISQTVLDKQSGIDAILQIDDGLCGIALRIRKPTWKQYNKRFTLGFHISKPNSQIHTILKAREKYFTPHLLLQVNGVNDEGYCQECNAILIQTNVFAGFLYDLIKTNTLETYYIPKLDAYDFEFSDVFTETNTGVDLFKIENNKIKYVWTNETNN